MAKPYDRRQCRWRGGRPYTPPLRRFGPLLGGGARWRRRASLARSRAPPRTSVRASPTRAARGSLAADVRQQPRPEVPLRPGPPRTARSTRGRPRQELPSPCGPPIDNRRSAVEVGISVVLMSVLVGNPGPWHVSEEQAHSDGTSLPSPYSLDGREDHLHYGKPQHPHVHKVRLDR